ncbi:hypothetical protein [Marinobacter sp. VGCF2001]|uniref:hypothetical protein n=1 Tax=Marinobacter sp. VGCF2001 TaxID=3417189 RepID=UPI003CF09260
MKTVNLVLILLWALSLAACDNDSEQGSAAPGSDLAAVPGDVVEVTLALDPAQLDWVGQKVFQNECAGRLQCLVHWNQGEAFPSLGIGHFIWYPAAVEGRFVESFPQLIDYMQQRGADIPAWLLALQPFDAPWPDRAAFLQAQDSAQVAQLRQFLAKTRWLQAEFIFRRAQASLGQVLAAAPEERRPALRAHLEALSATPGGVYALMDYVNFKGEGLAPAERYDGEGWGLLQVLLAMDVGPGQPRLEAFREAAGLVLARRAGNAANAIEHERWLPGWLKRLETYREPAS